MGYFTRLLGMQLLYKFERPQYAVILEQHKGNVFTEQITEAQPAAEPTEGYPTVGYNFRKRKKCLLLQSLGFLFSSLHHFKINPADLSLVLDKSVADIYGAEHLLRLFVKIGELLAFTELDNTAIELLQNHIHSLMDFIGGSHTLPNGLYRWVTYAL